MSVLNVVARTADKETVLILQWQPGTFLAMHSDGRLVEHPVGSLRADLLESQLRIATNERDNVEMFEQVISEQ